MYNIYKLVNRIRSIEMMDYIISKLNDGDVSEWGYLIGFNPDGYDYLRIANEEDEYQEICDFFEQYYISNHDMGIYIDDSEEIQKIPECVRDIQELIAWVEYFDKTFDLSPMKFIYKSRE